MTWNQTQCPIHTGKHQILHPEEEKAKALKAADGGMLPRRVSAKHSRPKSVLYHYKMNLDSDKNLHTAVANEI
jgi:hypothetical protein